MGEHADVFDDAKTPKIADMGDDYFIDVKVRCVDLHDPWDVDYISSPQKISQCGIFEDADGDQIRFKAWNGSDPPEFVEDEHYDITDMQMVYGKQADSYAFVIRSKTTATTTTAFPASTTGESGGTCPMCGSVLSEEHRHTGPGAPEVGWEYYQCPDCDEQMRPEAV